MVNIINELEQRNKNLLEENEVLKKQLHSPSKSIGNFHWSISKTYEKSFFENISVAHTYYVIHNKFLYCFEAN